MVFSMRLIVDAWNVLHVQGVLPSGLAGMDLIGLSRLLGRSRWNGLLTDLVCDGSPSTAHETLPEHIRVSWSGHDQEADDLIEAMIEQSTTPRRLTVVSSDLRLKKAAKRRRCKWLDAQSFLRALLDDLSNTLPENPPKASHETADQWRRTFGLDAEAVQQLHADAESMELPEAMASPQDNPPPNQPRPPKAPPLRNNARDTSSIFPKGLIEQAVRIAKGEA